MKILENELKEKIKEFNEKDIYIELKNAIDYHFIIKNAKILISREKLFITDERDENLIIELYYLDDVKINLHTNSVYLYMSNDLEIVLDY